jgi:hypothetical protein
MSPTEFCFFPHIIMNTARRVPQKINVLRENPIVAFTVHFGVFRDFLLYLTQSEAIGDRP